MESGIRPAQLPFALHNHSENLEKSQNSKKKKPKFVLQMLKDKHYYIPKAKDFSIPFLQIVTLFVFVHRLVTLGHVN